MLNELFGLDGQVAVVTTDVTNSDDLSATAQTAIDEFGRLATPQDLGA